MIHFKGVDIFLSSLQSPFTLSQNYKTSLVNVISPRKERGKLPPLVVLNSGSRYSLITREREKGKFLGEFLREQKGNYFRLKKLF